MTRIPLSAAHVGHVPFWRSAAPSYGVRSWRSAAHRFAAQHGRAVVHLGNDAAYVIHRDDSGKTHGRVLPTGTFIWIR